jgi:circadian clock protein KaiB
METTKQPSDSVEQAQYDEDVYELKLYVVGDNRTSQLVFENLKKICFKYLKGKCHIEVIDLTKNPALARTEQILAIPTLIRKSYPMKRIVGDLSNAEKVLEFLNLRTSNIMGGYIEKGYVEKTSTEQSESGTVKSKKSKDDLQPYIGSDLHRQLSQNLENGRFLYSRTRISIY